MDGLCSRNAVDANHNRAVIFSDITRKQLIWYGHVERMDPMRLPTIMINWKPEGRKKNEGVPEEPGKMGYIQP
jgi:hypothetical protein